jgi:hypothetical protein
MDDFLKNLGDSICKVAEKLNESDNSELIASETVHLSKLAEALAVMNILVQCGSTMR